MWLVGSAANDTEQKKRKKYISTGGFEPPT